MRKIRKSNSYAGGDRSSITSDIKPRSVRRGNSLFTWKVQLWWACTQVVGARHKERLKLIFSVGFLAEEVLVSRRGGE